MTVESSECPWAKHGFGLGKGVAPLESDAIQEMEEAEEEFYWNTKQEAEEW